MLPHPDVPKAVALPGEAVRILLLEDDPLSVEIVSTYLPRIAFAQSELHSTATLAEALRLHSDGRVSADATIGACWDADRLHLPRVFIEPDPKRFSTRVAHGEAPLAAAARLRDDGPPSWEALVGIAVG